MKVNRSRLCSDPPTSSSFVPMASCAKLCTVCKRLRRRSSVSQLQGGSRYKRCCKYWSWSAPLSTVRRDRYYGEYRRHLYHCLCVCSQLACRKAGYSSLGSRGSGMSLRNSLSRAATSWTLCSSSSWTSTPMSKSSRS